MEGQNGDIYKKALDSLTPKERNAFDRYTKRVQQMKHSRAGRNPTDIINAAMEEIPGAEEAIGQYDKNVGELMKAREKGS